MRPWHRTPANRVGGRWPAARRLPVTDTDESCGYVLHLPVAVANLASATDVGRKVVAALRCLPVVEVGSASLSEEGRPHHPHALCCNRRLGDTGRCLLSPRHTGACGDAP